MKPSSSGALSVDAYSTAWRCCSIGQTWTAAGLTAARGVPGRSGYAAQR
jgi:hypothetical protein